MILLTLFIAALFSLFVMRGHPLTKERKVELFVPSQYGLVKVEVPLKNLVEEPSSGSYKMGPNYLIPPADMDTPTTSSETSLGQWLSSTS